MARLPSDKFLVQQIGDDVVVFEDITEREIARFNPTNLDQVLQAQKTIHESELSEEDKAFAHFWSGYFYAHATGTLPDPYRVYQAIKLECPLCLALNVHQDTDGFYSAHVNPAGTPCRVNEVVAMRKEKEAKKKTDS